LPPILCWQQPHPPGPHFLGPHSGACTWPSPRGCSQNWLPIPRLPIFAVRPSGVFNLVSGGALLLASVIAGSLWSAFGASATFMAGASFAALAATGLLCYRPKARAAGHRTDM